ncbi:MAG: DUF503 domain-containing protein [Candidatus Omnitrophica bacterium]|nr:DUF503 domain-containing protein [Candidatus Omnitrophota bacterium]
MTVGILKLVLFIPQSNSLKEKRMILEGLKTKLRNRFNVAVAQIDDMDKWQKATLAIAGVENDKARMNSLLCGVLNFTEQMHNLNVIDYEMELL